MFIEFLNEISKLVEEAKRSPHIGDPHYPLYYDVVMKYVKDNNIVVSDVFRLAGKPQKSVFEIHCNNPVKHAHELANLMAEHTIFVSMKTDIANVSLSIWVRNEKKIVVNKLNVLCNIPNYFENLDGINFMPIEYELIQLYHKLYSPTYYDQWQNLCEIESGLFDTYIKKNGVDTSIPNSNSQKDQKDNNKKKDNIDRSFLMKWLKDRSDYIIIGDVAVLFMEDNNVNVPIYNKIQFITCADIQSMSSNIARLAKNNGYNTKIVKHDNILLNEPRLNKTIVNISKNNGKSTVLCEIYNSASFELIPFSVNNDVRIAYPNVIKMHYFLDILLIKMLTVKKALAENIGTLLIMLINGKMRHICKCDLYSSEDYMGCYSDVIIYIKGKIADSNYFPYRPAQYKLLNGEYKKI